MSGRNSRVVRNRDKGGNDAKLIASIIAVILIIIVTIIVVIFKVRNSKANNAKLDTNISYEYFLLSTDENLGVINKNGELLIEAKYSKVEIPNPSKDVFICYSEDGQAQILNKDGTEILSEYSQVEAVYSSNENAEVEKFVLKYEKDGLYGIIDLERKCLNRGDLQRNL